MLPLLDGNQPHNQTDGLGARLDDTLHLVRHMGITAEDANLRLSEDSLNHWPQLVQLVLRDLQQPLEHAALFGETLVGPPPVHQPPPRRPQPTPDH